MNSVLLFSPALLECLRKRKPLLGYLCACIEVILEVWNRESIFFSFRSVKGSRKSHILVGNRVRFQQATCTLPPKFLGVPLGPFYIGWYVGRVVAVNCRLDIGKNKTRDNLVPLWTSIPTSSSGVLRSAKDHGNRKERSLPSLRVHYIFNRETPGYETASFQCWWPRL